MGDTLLGELIVDLEKQGKIDLVNAACPF